jgi:MFS superfamily sulfate permease-like transporter
VLSILLFFKRSWWPHGEVLGQIEGESGWHADHDGLVGTELPGIVVFRWEAPLFFANAGMFREQIRALVRERKPRWVVLQCEAITDIDVTAADVLEQLDVELNDQGVNIAFVELRERLKDLVYDYGLVGTLDAEHFYGSIEEALADIERQRSADLDT